MATVWLLGILASSWQVPEWMNLLGAWISIAFLTLIGAVNLIAVLRAAPNQIVQTVGIKGRVLGRLTSATNPLAVGMVGALFALSFDTMSQAALFAVAGTQFGSAGFSLILGLVFMAGMMITDGLHGIWVVRMLNRANELAIIASRVMGLAVASLSLIVALYGFMRLISPTIDVAGEGKELTLGVCIMATMGLSYIVAVMVTRRRA